MERGGVFLLGGVMPCEVVVVVVVVALPRPLAPSSLALLAPSPLPPRAPPRGVLDAPLPTPLKRT